MGLLSLVHEVWQKIGYEQLAYVAVTVPITVLGAAYTFLTQDDHNEPRTFRGFLRFCFPERIVRARQTRLDILYIGAKKCCRFLWGWAFVGNLVVAYAFFEALNHLSSSGPVRPQAPDVFEELLFVVVAAVVADLMGFFAHFFLHRVRVLWEFHVIHHSATTLNPLTNHRFHPIQEIWDALWSACGTGLWIALYAKALSLPLADMTILGIDANIFVNCLSFHHLRHSHIYMRYPLWLERVVMSPAQHQIHHSREARHLDRNFGLLLSCWDQIFGTIVYSEPAPVTNLGLAERQENYLSTWALFVQPFIELLRKARLPNPSEQHQSIRNRNLSTDRMRQWYAEAQELRKVAAELDDSDAARGVLTAARNYERLAALLHTT